MGTFNKIDRLIYLKEKDGSYQTSNSMLIVLLRICYHDCYFSVTSRQRVLTKA